MKKPEVLAGVLQLLAALVVVMGAYHWRDFSHQRTAATLAQQRDQAARGMVQLLEGKKPGGPEQLNQFFAQIGRPDISFTTPTPQPPSEEPVPSALARE